MQDVLVVFVNGSKEAPIHLQIMVFQLDTFDIDYSTWIWHQFGANHTFTTGNEGTGVHMNQVQDLNYGYAGTLLA
jgi:hypothetical protein